MSRFYNLTCCNSKFWISRFSVSIVMTDINGMIVIIIFQIRGCLCPLKLIIVYSFRGFSFQNLCMKFIQDHATGSLCNYLQAWNFAEFVPYEYIKSQKVFSVCIFAPWQYWRKYKGWCKFALPLPGIGFLHNTSQVCHNFIQFTLCSLLLNVTWHNDYQIW